MFRVINKRIRVMCLMGKLKYFFLKVWVIKNFCKYNELKWRSWLGRKKSIFLVGENVIIAEL